MKKYRIKIGYIASFDVCAKNKKEAEEYARFEFDQSQHTYDEIKITEIKRRK